jgi:hypothetical protein
MNTRMYLFLYMMLTAVTSWMAVECYRIEQFAIAMVLSFAAGICSIISIALTFGDDEEKKPIKS